jgi:hypothetical protein
MYSRLRVSVPPETHAANRTVRVVTLVHCDKSSAFSHRQSDGNTSEVSELLLHVVIFRSYVLPIALLDLLEYGNRRQRIKWYVDCHHTAITKGQTSGRLPGNAIS